MRRSRIIVHRVALLPVDCVNREISGQWLVKVIGRAVRFCPVVKDIIRLVVRTRGLGRRAAVHGIRILRNNLILMSRVRIRCILHRHRVMTHGPACTEHHISGHRRCKIRRAAVRVLPAAEVIARAGTRRGAADCGRCDQRIAVNNSLRCRRHTSTVRQEADCIARQEVVVRKGRSCRRCIGNRCRESTSRRLLLNRHAAVHHGSGLRDVVGDTIHSVIVSIASLRGRRAARKRCARKFAELIDIVPRKQEANRT